MDAMDGRGREDRLRQALATWAASLDPGESAAYRYLFMPATVLVDGSLVRWPGEPGALAASVELVPLGLLEVPPAPLGIDVSPSGAWIAEDDREIVTSAGARVSRDVGTSVAWVGDDAFIVSDWGRTDLHDAIDGVRLASWETHGYSIVSGDRVIDLDLEDDPNGGLLVGLTVRSAAGSLVLDRRFEDRGSEYGFTISQVISTPAGGLVIVGEEPGDAWVLDDPSSDPRHFHPPVLYHWLQDGRTVLQALDDDCFALIGPEQVWGWRAGDRAITLIHEGRLSAGWVEPDPAGRSRRLGDRGEVVERPDGWWLVEIALR